jgi:diacylglycerol kinase
VKAFFNSFVYAWRGLVAAFRERSLAIEGCIAIAVLGAAVYFQVTVTEWLIILVVIGLVMGLELMNSAIERLVDLVTTERRPDAGRIKDIAAGAVLFASIMAAVVGVVIFYKYLLALFV